MFEESTTSLTNTDTNQFGGQNHFIDWYNQEDTHSTMDTSFTTPISRQGHLGELDLHITARIQNKNKKKRHAANVRPHYGKLSAWCRTISSFSYFGLISAPISEQNSNVASEVVSFTSQHSRRCCLCIDDSSTSPYASSQAKATFWLELRAECLRTTC